jgi:hypothetical protein
MLCEDRDVLGELSTKARKPKTIAAYTQELEKIYQKTVNLKKKR